MGVLSVWGTTRTTVSTFWIEEADRSAGIKVISDQSGGNSADQLHRNARTVEGQRVLTQHERSDTGYIYSFMPLRRWGCRARRSAAR